MSNDPQKEECCPKLDPALWDNKTFTWNNKKFIKDRVFTLFYMPVNFGQVIVRLLTKAQKAGAAMPDQLCLSDHVSRWGMDIYLAVDKEVPGVRNVTLSGQYLSKVYEGDFKETGNWCKDFQAFAKNRGMDIKKWFMWYTTCPRCAKKYGKNYVAIIGRTS